MQKIISYLVLFLLLFGQIGNSFVYASEVGNNIIEVQALDNLETKLDSSINKIDKKLKNKKQKQRLKQKQKEIKKQIKESKKKIKKAKTKTERKKIAAETTKSAVLKTVSGITKYNNIENNIDEEIKKDGKKKEKAQKALKKSLKKENTYSLIIKTKLTKKQISNKFKTFDKNLKIKRLYKKNKEKYFEIHFSNNSILKNELFENIEEGELPESFLGIKIVQPEIFSINSFEGENISQTWGVESYNLFPLLDSSAQKIKVGIIDTGINKNHPDLQQNILEGYDFVNNDTDANDDQGHGTHVAGVIAANINGQGIIGVNPYTELVPLKICDKDGLCPSYAISKALFYAEENKIDVVNMSLGGRGNPQTHSICDALNSYVQNGGTAIVASGNSASDVANFVPGGCRDAITVGAVDKSNQTAHFSNYGSKVDLLAPGVDIYSTHLNNSYKKMSGTSMATPHVTGLVSLMKQKQNNLKSTDIKSILLQSRDANTHTIHTETIFSSLGSTPIEPPKEEPKPPVEPSVPTPLPTVEGNAKVILEATINPNLKPLPDQERIEYPKFEPVIIESTGPTPQSIDYGKILETDLQINSDGNSGKLEIIDIPEIHEPKKDTQSIAPQSYYYDENGKEIIDEIQINNIIEEVYTEVKDIQINPELEQYNTSNLQKANTHISQETVEFNTPTQGTGSRIFTQTGSLAEGTGSSIQTIEAEEIQVNGGKNVLEIQNTNGLVASYDLNGNAQDSSGNNNHGTASNVTYETLENGNKVAVFNGSNSIININNNYNYKNDYSVSMVIYPRNFKHQNLWNSYENTDGTMGIMDNKFGKGLVFGYWNGDINIVKVPLEKIKLNLPNHIVGTKSKTNGLQIYLNGVLVDHNPNAIGNGNSLNNLYSSLGGHPAKVDYFSGKISQTKIFNKALSEQEIQQIYTKGKQYLGIKDEVPTPTTPGLLASYDLNGNAQDSSGNNNHGTASNVTYETLANGNKVAVFNNDGLVYFNDINAKSISLWASKKDISDSNNMLFNPRGNIGKYLGQIHSNGNIYFDLGSGNLEFPHGLTASDNGNFFHWTFIQDKGKFKLYKDGKLIGEKNDPNQLIFGRIGKGNQWYSYNYTYDGKISNVKAYNKVLTQQEIQQLYTEGKQYLGIKDEVPTPTTPGLVASYDLNGNAQDSSGNNNHGTASNVTYETLANGNKVAVFNGSNSYIDIQNSLIDDYLNGSDKISVSILAKRNSVGKLQELFYGRTSAGTAGIEIAFGADDTLRVSGRSQTGDSYQSVYSNKKFTETNKWYHIITVYDYNSKKLIAYVNNQKVLDGNVSFWNSKLNFKAEYINIGTLKGANKYWYDGKLANFKIFNKALNEQEIQQLYTEGKEYLGIKDDVPTPTTPGLIASYDLNGNTQDSSGNNNHGTASNVTYETLANGNKVAVFNGNNSKILKSGLPISSYKNLSYSTWINPKNSQSGHIGIVGNDLGLRVLLKEGKIYLDSRYNGKYNVINNGTETINGVFQHIVVTFETNGKLTGYLNGKNIGEIPVIGKENADQHGLFIGANHHSNITRNYFNGKISQTKIFNKSLSEQEIQQLYTEGKEYLGLNTPTPTPVEEAKEIPDLLYSFDFNGNVGDSNGKAPKNWAHNTEYEVNKNINTKSIIFNGGNSVGFQSRIGSNKTVSYWIKANANGPLFTDNYYRIHLLNHYNSNGKLGISLNLGGDKKTPLQTSVNYSEKYVHIVAKWVSGYKYNIYINGKHEGYINDPKGRRSLAFNTFGRTENGYYLKGTLNQLKIFNRQLTDAEIERLYKEGQEYIGIDYSTIPDGVTPELPIAPNNFIGGMPTAYKIKYTWKDISGGLNQESKFVIKDETGKIIMDNIAANDVEFTEDNLTPDTNYHRKVCGVNTTGESCSELFTFKTEKNIHEYDLIIGQSASVNIPEDVNQFDVSVSNRGAFDIRRDSDVVQGNTIRFSARRESSSTITLREKTGAKRIRYTINVRIKAPVSHVTLVLGEYLNAQHLSTRDDHRIEDSSIVSIRNGRHIYSKKLGTTIIRSSRNGRLKDITHVNVIEAPDPQIITDEIVAGDRISRRLNPDDAKVSFSRGSIAKVEYGKNSIKVDSLKSGVIEIKVKADRGIHITHIWRITIKPKPIRVLDCFAPVGIECNTNWWDDVGVHEYRTSDPTIIDLQKVKFTSGSRTYEKLKVIGKKVGTADVYVYEHGDHVVTFVITVDPPVQPISIEKHSADVHQLEKAIIKILDGGGGYKHLPYDTNIIHFDADDLPAPAGSTARTGKVDITGKNPGNINPQFKDKYGQTATISVRVKDTKLRLNYPKTGPNGELVLKGGHYEYVSIMEIAGFIQNLAVSNDNITAQVIEIDNNGTLERVIKVIPKKTGTSLLQVTDSKGNIDQVNIIVGDVSGGTNPDPGNGGGDSGGVSQNGFTEFKKDSIEELGLGIMSFKVPSDAQEVGIQYQNSLGQEISELLVLNNNGYYEIILEKDDSVDAANAYNNLVPYFINSQGVTSLYSDRYISFGTNGGNQLVIIDDSVIKVTNTQKEKIIKQLKDDNSSFIINKIDNVVLKIEQILDKKHGKNDIEKIKETRKVIANVEKIKNKYSGKNRLVFEYLIIQLESLRSKYSNQLYSLHIDNPFEQFFSAEMAIRNLELTREANILLIGQGWKNGSEGDFFKKQYGSIYSKKGLGFLYKNKKITENEYTLYLSYAPTTTSILDALEVEGSIKSILQTYYPEGTGQRDGFTSAITDYLKDIVDSLDISELHILLQSIVSELKNLYDGKYDLEYAKQIAGDLVEIFENIDEILENESEYDKSRLKSYIATTLALELVPLKVGKIKKVKGGGDSATITKVKKLKETWCNSGPKIANLGNNLNIASASCKRLHNRKSNPGYDWASLKGVTWSKVARPDVTKVENNDLKKIIETNYGKHAVAPDGTTSRVGNGSTSDALRYERKTGILISHQGHQQKVVDLRRRVKSWINTNANEYNPKASSDEIKIATDILDDLNKAFNEKY